MKYKIRICVCIFALLSGAVGAQTVKPGEIRAITREMWFEDTLTSEQKQKTEAAASAAAGDPAVIAAMAKLREASAAYRENKARPVKEREKQIAPKYRAALAAATEAVRKAMLAADPTLAPLLALGDAARSVEGESKADSEVRNRAVFAPVTDKPGLPRVLLIGDSISIGYTKPVRDLLEGKANVHRIPANGGPTTSGIERLGAWLGDGKWDVIHFNFGIHDAKYLSETELRTTPEQYVANLRKIVTTLKSTGAKIIFATTTPIPAELSLSTAKQRFDIIPPRNAAAVKCMQANGVAIDDLYAAVLPALEKIQRPNNVHYTPEGYELIAKAVASSIEQQLPKNK